MRDRMTLWWYTHLDSILHWRRRAREIRAREIERIAPQSPYGFAEGVVFVGDYKVAATSNDEGRLLAVFRDDAVRLSSGSRADQEIIITMPGTQVADRLDMLGVDENVAGAAFDASITRRLSGLAAWRKEQSRVALSDLDWRTWVTKTAAIAQPAPPEPAFIIVEDADDFWWLLGQAALVADVVSRLRLVLLAFPHLPVTVRIRNLQGSRFGAAPRNAPSTALREIREPGTTYSPTIVLTEGKTDAEFLSQGLAILYPHLTDLIRFMDFHVRPEGSASALVRTVRSFAAAGISNRIVAVFDNDTAGSQELRTLSNTRLPANIIVMQYPALTWARDYPTIHPSEAANEPEPNRGDINGIAGSIEMYLGRELLVDDRGSPYPIQLVPFGNGDHHQGEVVGKRTIQRKFRAKASTAMTSTGPRPGQDWSGLDLILQQIIRAHRNAGQSADALSE
jgi:hypothetical protein